MLQRLGKAIGNGAVKQGQTDEDVRVFVDDLHEPIPNIQVYRQLFHTLPAQRLFLRFTLLHLAAGELPEKPTGLILRPLADQKPVLLPDQRRHHFHGLFPGQNHGGDGRHLDCARDGREGFRSGLAAVIIGDVIFGKVFTNFALKLLSVVIGSVIYYAVYSLVIWLGMSGDDMKLITSLIVALFLSIPYWKGKYFSKPAKKGGAANA